MSNLNLQKLREWVWPWPWTFNLNHCSKVWLCWILFWLVVQVLSTSYIRFPRVCDACTRDKKWNWNVPATLYLYYLCWQWESFLGWTDPAVHGLWAQCSAASRSRHTRGSQWFDLTSNSSPSHGRLLAVLLPSSLHSDYNNTVVSLTFNFLSC